MKHGPLALVDDTMPILVIATQDRMHNKMLRCCWGGCGTGAAPRTGCTTRCSGAAGAGLVLGRHAGQDAQQDAQVLLGRVWCWGGARDQLWTGCGSSMARGPMGPTWLQNDTAFSELPFRLILLCGECSIVVAWSLKPLPVRSACCSVISTCGRAGPS
jgi:hypothetical protein